MKTTLKLLLVFAVLIFTGCDDDFDTKGLSMTLTTAKNVGDKIRLDLRALSEDRPNVWIDLNNNKKKDPGEAVTKFENDFVEYTLGAKTVTIYGTVTAIFCYHNELTALDVSKNIELHNLSCSHNKLTELNLLKNVNLSWIDCYNNQIKGEKMGAFVNNLPKRDPSLTSWLFIVNTDSGSGEGNEISVSQVNTAKARNWEVNNHKGEEYHGK
ncbi:MAG: hypothetical protein GX102_14035 [Porphyromonadaceae bacterium]|nr:hypothetical protein [Porphyromonadaceae bacterium]